MDAPAPSPALIPATLDAPVAATGPAADGSKPPLTIRLCAPRGFCAGVERAIEIVVAALKRHGSPVYVRHEIVHNRFVVDGLRERGAVFVRELDDIPPEHADRPVVFSAHGVPKSVPAEAERREMLAIDATCPLVSKVHKQAMLHERRGRHVVLVGHAGHPEVIGTMGQLPEGAVTLVETPADVARLDHAGEGEALGFVTQTTLSVDDTADVIAALRARFPAIVAPSAESICYATTNRQGAVRAAAPGCDLFVVVGAPNSSNSRRLVEVAAKAGARRAVLVQRADGIDWSWTREWGAKEWGEAGRTPVLGVSAGASAPQVVVDEVIAAFAGRFNATIELAATVREDEHFPAPRSLRDVEIAPADMAFVNG